MEVVLGIKVRFKIRRGKLNLDLKAEIDRPDAWVILARFKTKLWLILTFQLILKIRFLKMLRKMWIRTTNDNCCLQGEQPKPELRSQLLRQVRPLHPEAILGFQTFKSHLLEAYPKFKLSILKLANHALSQISELLLTPSNTSVTEKFKLPLQTHVHECMNLHNISRNYELEICCESQLK